MEINTVMLRLSTRVGISKGEILMQYVKTLILGAGPVGLTVGNMLAKKNDKDFIILEAANEVGGLCKSTIVDGSAFDIGGGHFLYVRRPVVNSFLFEFMPESEWSLFQRNSKISIHETLIDHPFEANIYQLPIDVQVEYLKSIAKAGSNVGSPMPHLFKDWIRWKLGDKIADSYMIPYNEKMFGKNLDNLGTYWMEKLPNVSFEEVLKSCLEKHAYGSQPGHAQFYYPKKFGYGELWNRMGEKIQKHIKLNSPVVQINIEQKMVICKDGSKYKADRIITSIPWKSFQLIDAPLEVTEAVQKLQHTGIETRYFSKKLETDAHWIYYPESEKPYHRILVRHNFCTGSRGYWTETNLDRIGMFQSNAQYSYRIEYAYPLNTVEKPMAMEKIIRYAESNEVYPIGRWGEHQHYNSDLSVEIGMNFVETRMK